MDYVTVITRINTINNVFDLEQIVPAVNALTDDEEFTSAKDALLRAVLSKCRDGHPSAPAMSVYALRVR